MGKRIVWAYMAVALVAAFSCPAGARNLFPRAGQGLMGSTDHWTYEPTTDAASGEEEHKATLGSQNLIESQTGETQVLMTLGETAHAGFVEFNLKNGDWGCLHGCHLQLAIDDAPPITIDAKPADLRGYLLVLTQPGRFIDMLYNTNSISITASTQGHPDQVMMFATKDFQLPRLTP